MIFQYPVLSEPPRSRSPFSFSLLRFRITVARCSPNNSASRVLVTDGFSLSNWIIFFSVWFNFTVAFTVAFFLFDDITSISNGNITLIYRSVISNADCPYLATIFGTPVPARSVQHIPNLSESASVPVARHTAGVFLIPFQNGQADDPVEIF